MKDLNLVPKSYFQKRRQRKKIIFYCLFSAVIAVAIAVIMLMPVLKIQNLRSRLASLDLRAKETSMYIETENEFNAVKSIYLQRENEAKRLAKSGLDMLTIIEKLESYLPDRIFIQNISVGKGKSDQVDISIRGIAGSEEEIATFYDYVSKDGYFNSIRIGAVSNLQTSGQKNSNKSNSGSEQKESNSSYGFDAVINLTTGK